MYFHLSVKACSDPSSPPLILVVCCTQVELNGFLNIHILFDNLGWWEFEMPSIQLQKRLSTKDKIFFKNQEKQIDGQQMVLLVFFLFLQVNPEKK